MADDIELQEGLVNPDPEEEEQQQPKIDPKLQNTASDWIRDMRMSADVNKTTVGVDTDMVTPELLIATSRKLLDINRRKVEQDPKDSLQFQRVYGPQEFFSEHIMRDGDRVARQLLWKATNKGNLDFMQVGALDQHVSDVFNNSKLANMVDASSPLETVDASYKITRIGEGGIADISSAPDEMRLVQPSFLGYIDPVRSPESLRVGLDAYIAKNVMKGSDGKLYQKFINAHTGKEELVDSVTAAKSIITTADMMNVKANHCFAVGGKTGVRIVKKSDVDYYLPHMDDAFSVPANLVTGMSGVKEMRLLMGCLHPMTPLVVVSKRNEVDIIKASDACTGSGSVPGADVSGAPGLYKIRTVVAKLPPNRSTFRKIVLRSGRALITSRDHRWPVLRHGKVVQVQAERLRKGDQVLRSMFTDLPSRRMFVNGILLNKDMAVLLGYAVRSLQNTAAGSSIVFMHRHLGQVERALKKFNINGRIKTGRQGYDTLTVADGDWFEDWLTENVCYTAEYRRVPSCILSSGATLCAEFLDAYSADETLVGIDSKQCYWLLELPNAVLRDGIALVLARTGVDTLYRDAVQRNGNRQLALKLVDSPKLFGSMVLDEVKTVFIAQQAALMIDLDIDDNMFAAANGIVTHNSKYPLQAISVEGREAPLVRNIDSASGKDMSTLTGKYFGARFAKKPGRVVAVRKDRIDLQYDDGTTGKLELYRNFPMNSKGFITNTPQVKAGDVFKEGDLLASSNYTDDKGIGAPGANLRTAWISWKGGTYEDAIVLSESAAKKMAATTMYSTDLDLDKTVTLGKRNFLSWKPGDFTKEQLENLDDDGIVKPGTVLHQGDPVVLAVQTTEPSPGTLGKKVLTDVSQTWEHQHPGTVTDVVRTRKGVRVLATVTTPVEIGDKLSGCYDDKTEIFTRRGFVPFSLLSRTDEVAVLHPDGSASFEIPRARQVAWHEGCMVGYKSKRADFLVTPDHDMAFVPRYMYENGSSTLIKRKAASVYKQRIAMRVSACFDGVLARPAENEIRLAEPSRITTGSRHATKARLKNVFRRDDFAAFLGLYLAEGHCVRSGKERWIRIAQHDDVDGGEARCAGIRALLDRMGLEYHYYDHQYFMISNWPLHSYVEPFHNSYGKFIPDEVFTSWSKREMQLLLEWYYLGDGEKTHKGTSRCATVSSRLADGLQRLYILTGNYSVVHSTRAANAKSGRVFKVSASAKVFNMIGGDKSGWYVKTDYAGYIYCVSTSTGVVLTRRNGVSVWNGQCYGNKGVCSMILPDDQMPCDKDGKPFEMLLSPLGLVSRTNASQLHEAMLGKVARKTGHYEVLPAFMEDGSSMKDYVLSRLKKAHVSADDDLYDPENGRKIPNVVNGVSYIYRLKHLSESKLSARGTNAYSTDETPGGSGYEGCFPAMQNVMTIHGLKSIATICEKRQREYVLTWDGRSWLYKRVSDWFTYHTDTANILKIAVEYNMNFADNGRWALAHGGCIYPTRNHKLLRPDMSVVLAGDVKPGDMLAGTGAKATDDQISVIAGTLLGDASLRSDCSLQCEHALAQQNWLKWKYEALSGLWASMSSSVYKTTWRNAQTGERRTGKGCGMSVPRSALLAEMRKVIYDGKRRRITQEALDKLGELGFCVWFLDDGSMHNRTKEKGKPAPEAKIATQGFSKDEVELACRWINKLTGVADGAVSDRYATRSGEITAGIRFKREASWKVAGIVARNIPWEAIPKSKAWLAAWCREQQEHAGVVPHNFDSELGIVPIRVVSVSAYKHDKKGVDNVPVYDFTVEDTHKYTLSGGVLCSNSKRLGMLEVGAMVSHGAFDNLIDAKLIRGQNNSDFWRQVRTGGIPTIPGEPLVQKKFFAHLQGAGVNVRKTAKGISVFALTNRDVRDLAGPREVKSDATYEAKNFRPIDGGLFGNDVFGVNGNHWGYIQLDEPLPNPVMEEPLSRLLRMSEKDFIAVAAGEREVNGMKSSSDIQAKLAKIDLEQEAKQAQKEFKDAPASRKDNALKRYVAIERMRRQGVQPAEYMLDRIPVLPPVYRPISTHAGVTMVADANYLYKQLLDARDDLREARDLPKEYQDRARAGLYRTWKELTGMYDPEDVKLRNKNVGGLLKWALGTGPKWSAFQRKVLGTSVDTVGRGAIVPNSKINVDQIGIPIPMAMDIMAPFVERSLVKRGYTPLDAMKMVKKRTPQAMEMLQKVVETHPVEMNRAPSLHKYSIMAFKPVLVQGNAIQIHPSVCSGFGADFDGDTVNIHVPVSDNARKEALNRMLPSKNLVGVAEHKIMNKPEKEYMQGLYIATRMGQSPDGRARIFRTLDEARAAYRSGEIDIDTPIQILSK